MHTKLAKRGRRRGSIVVMLLLLLPILLLMLGFSVDLAHMMRVRSQMQATTDLAAKSGANILSKTQDTNAAIAAVIEIGNANEVAGQALTIDPADIQFGRSVKNQDGTYDFQVNVMPYNSVQVAGRRDENSAGGPVNMFFSKFLGAASFNPTFVSRATFIDVDICLVLDRSSSMKMATTDTANFMSASDPRICQPPLEDSRWIAMADGVGSFVSNMNSSPAQEKLSVVTFSSNDFSGCGEVNTTVTTEQDLTTNMQDVTAAMDARTTSIWNGNTDIAAGIAEANVVLTGVNARPLAEKIMIVFTDGAYTGENPMNEAAKSKPDGIRIFTITYGDGADTEDMIAISNHTDGYHYHAPDAAALQQVFDEISAVIDFLTK